MRILYVECSMGAAGDMLMGALYELCQEKERFLGDMNSPAYRWRRRPSPARALPGPICGCWSMGRRRAIPTATAMRAITTMPTAPCQRFLQ